MNARIRTARNLERQETPWNARGIARTVTCNVSSENATVSRPATLPLLGSPESGQVSESGTSDQSQVVDFETDEPRGVTSRSRHAASRGVTHHQGSVQALPWSCLVPIHSVLTDDSVKAQGSCARIVHGSFTTGGLETQQTGKLSPTDRCPKFSHPQFTGRPWPMTSGGMLNAWRALIFLDRTLNSLSIIVQKKGAGFAQKTQQKPTGFLGGFSC